MLKTEVFEGECLKKRDISANIMDLLKLFGREDDIQLHAGRRFWLKKVYNCGKFAVGDTGLYIGPFLKACLTALFRMI